MCDTDSMAIVAAADGGAHIPVVGGPLQPDEVAGVKALSLEAINDIRARFNSLNPYNKHLLPDILKLERRGLCYAISAKRYVIYDE